MNRAEALELLTRYNQETYHIRHALTLEAAMRWLAVDQGYEEQQDFWALVGLLHDIDFERYPDHHCEMAPQLLKEIDAPEAFIRAVCSHGYGLHPGSPKPEHQMEKILYAVDELTGIVFAASLMRPSRSVQDMELKSLRKKYKDKAFAAGCSREVIGQGAEMLGWSLDELMEKCLAAMRAGEQQVQAELERLLPSA